jgi:hypothetical protein
VDILTILEILLIFHRVHYFGQAQYFQIQHH